MVKKPSKEEMKIFMNSTIHVEKGNFCHVLVVKDAEEMGIEKSLIYNNAVGIKKYELEEIFPYIEPLKLHQLYNELIDEGKLITKKQDA